MEIVLPPSPSQVFLHYSVAIGVIVFVATAIWFMYRMSQTLDNLDRSLEEVEELMSEVKENLDDISAVRRAVKTGALGVVTTLITALGSATQKLEK